MSYWHSRKARLGAIARTIGPVKSLKETPQSLKDTPQSLTETPCREPDPIAITRPADALERTQRDRAHPVTPEKETHGPA